MPSNTSFGRCAYTGQVELTGLDLYDYKARIYDPALGRFLQIDPIGYEDQMNLYAYVANDPVNNIDPNGMERVLATSKDENFLHKLLCGIGRPVEGVGYNAKYATAQLLGVHEERRGFAANAINLGAEFAKQEPLATARILADGYIDKGLIENSGSLISNSIMAGKFKGATGVGGKTVFAGNLAQNVSGGVLASLDDAFDTLTSAGVSPELLNDDWLAAI